MIGIVAGAIGDRGARRHRRRAVLVDLRGAPCVFRLPALQVVQRRPVDASHAGENARGVSGRDAPARIHPIATIRIGPAGGTIGPTIR